MKYALVILLLCACTKVEYEGPDAQGYAWQKDGPTGKPVIHRGYDVFLNCGIEPNAKSCARIANGICDIYLPPDPAPWQEPHELRHCAGWTHPNPFKDARL